MKNVKNSIKRRTLSSILAVTMMVLLIGATAMKVYAGEYHVFKKFPTATVSGTRTVSCYVDKACEIRFMYNFAYTNGNTGTMSVFINNDSTGQLLKSFTVPINKTAGYYNCGYGQPGNYSIMMIPNSSDSCIEITQLYTVNY